MMEQFLVHEDDIVMLEALIRSPAFAALKRTLDNYRKECFSVLKTEKDTHRIFQTQGRIIGLDVIENLPGILVKNRQDKLKAAEKEKNFKPDPNPPKQNKRINN